MMQRYTSSYEYHPQDRGYPSGKMDEEEDGDYVLYTDHLEEIAKKDAEIVALRKKVRDSDYPVSYEAYRMCYDDLNKAENRIKELEEWQLIRDIAREALREKK